MLDEAELGDVFNGIVTPVMDDVVIFSGIASLNEVITLPAGMVWSDFEEVGFWGDNTAGSGSKPKAYNVLDKKIMTNYPTSWTIELWATFSSTTRYCFIEYLSDNSCKVTNSASNFFPCLIVGRKKRYATETTTAVINVNNGNPIGTNYREKIPASMLPSSMLDDAGKIKSSVSVLVEVDYDGAQGGDAGWGQAGWILNSGSGGYGAKVALLDNEFIVVQTGSFSLLTASSTIGNPFGSSATRPSANTLPARVIAINTERFAKPVV